MNGKTKKGTLGTIVSIGLMLIVAGITFSVLSKVFRSTDESQETYAEIIEQLKDLRSKEVGSRNLLVAQLNDETAVIGFSKGNRNLELVKSLFQTTIGRDEKRFIVHKPVEQCGEDSCVCYCDTPSIDDDKPENEPLVLSCEKLSCMKGQNFGGLDFASRAYNEFADADNAWQESRNGFLFHRGRIILYNQGRSGTFPVFETPPAMTGRFTIYLERKESGAAVCTALIEGSCTPARTEEDREARTMPVS